MAVPESLQSLVDDGVIDRIEARLMSGKEAAVFVVVRQGELIAAKVYKARDRRTFKATADYTEGRNQTRNTRDKRAMGKRTSYGRELIEDSWRDMEYRALFDAMHGGVRVPKPIMLYDEVLLMELLVDENGDPASRLADFELEPEAAEPMLREVYKQVRLLLGTGKVHGDLSAFNILMAKDGPTLIDMPQVVDASGNNQARDILRRDLENVTEHLAKFDARLLRFRHCGEGLWQHFQRGTLDQATEPQEGGMRGDRNSGRRALLAERGRMGRGDGPQGQGQGRRPDNRPDLRQQSGPRPDHRPDLRQAQGQGGPRPDHRPDLRQQGNARPDIRPDLRQQSGGSEHRPDLRQQGGSRPDHRPDLRQQGGGSEHRPDLRQQGGSRPDHRPDLRQQGGGSEHRPDLRQQRGARPDHRPDLRQQGGGSEHRPDLRQQSGPRPDTRPDLRQQGGPERRSEWDRPRQDGPRQDGPRQDAPRQDAPRHDDAPRHQEQRPSPRHDAPRNDGGRGHGGPRDGGARTEESPRVRGPRPDGRPRPDAAPREDRPRQDAPREDRPPQNAPRPHHPEPKARAPRTAVPVDYVRRSGGKPR